MADLRRVELDDLVNRPGTYFNPSTEVLLIVDDSPELEAELFDTGELDQADWVMISDEVPVDEHARDELLQAYEIRLHAGAAGSPEDEDELVEDEDELEPDEDIDPE